MPFILLACDTGEEPFVGTSTSAGGGTTTTGSGASGSDPLDFSSDDDFDENSLGDDALDPTITAPTKLAEVYGDLVTITKDDRLVYTTSDGVWSIKAAIGAQPRKASSLVGDIFVKGRTIFTFAEVDYSTGEGNMTFWTPAVGRRSIGKTLLGGDQVAARHDDAWVMFARNVQTETLDIVMCSADKQHAQVLVEDAGRGSDVTCGPSYAFAGDQAVVSWCTVGSTTATLARWNVDPQGVWQRADISVEAQGVWSSIASGMKLFYVSAAGEGRVTDMTTEQKISDGVGWGVLRPDGNVVFFTVGDQLRRSDMSDSPIPIVVEGFDDPVAWKADYSQVIYSSNVVYEDGTKQDLHTTPTAWFNAAPTTLVAQPIAVLSRSAMTTAGAHALYLTDVTPEGGTLNVRPLTGAAAVTFPKVYAVLAAAANTILFVDNRDPTGYPVVGDLKVYTVGGTLAPAVLEPAIADGGNIQVRSDKLTVGYQRDNDPDAGIWVRPIE
ncbi:MAG TPA: hypothetical protein VFB62_27810 [Polyangiaceae bacterium]|nr:hypothetical protein [Polyangiaceae bacterium]